MSETDPSAQVAKPDIAFQPSFSTGELAPALWYRSDLAKWRGGASTMLNWYLQVQGNIARRPGTQYIGTCKNPAGEAILIPFQFNTEQQYVVEAGNLYFRFVYQGAYVMNGSVPYEIATPYEAADLSSLRYVQSADVLTIVHPSYPPMELGRYGTLDWRLTAMNIGTQLAAPTGVAVTATLGSNFGTGGAPAPLNFVYAVTACSTTTQDEGPLSAPVTCSNISTSYYAQYGTENVLTWDAVAGADFYKVYQQYEGVWAFCASTVELTLADQGISPDTALSPPTGTNPFAGNNWPGVVGYFQERRIFGGSNADPETIWTSKSGNYTDFDVSSPLVDDDAITFTLAARQVNQIRHFVPLTDMIIMTGGGGWRLNGQNGAVSPSNFDVSPQTFVGASEVAPITIGNYILFVEAKGSSVREIVYNLYANSYVSEDRSVLSNHLLLGHSIVSWAYADSPHKVLWAVRDDGALLSLTYLKEQEIYAWAQHNTQGVFHSVAVISETVNGVTEDVPYFVVVRPSGSGGEIAMVERMHSQLLGPANDDPAQAWYVDCGLQYSGAPATVISGLDYLDGEIVQVLADGVPSSATVEGGSITLGTAASTVTVGLGFTSTLRTLPIDSPRESLFGCRKRVAKIRLAVQNTAGLVAYAATGDTPLPFAGLANDDPNDPSDDTVTSLTVVSGVQEAVAIENWDRDGMVYIEAATALPASISSMAVLYEAAPP